MSTIKKFLNLIFIDGLSGMALGLFSTLIIGTILKQAADLIGGDFGYYLGVFAVMAQRLTGAGIGIGVAYKYKSSTYVTLSAAAAGMIGAYATAIISGSILSDGALVYSGPGDPLSAFIAALAGIAVGSLPAGKTKLDLLITPAVTIIAGGAVGIIVGPPVSTIMTRLGSTASDHGHCRICHHGYGTHPSHQFCCPWHHPRSLRSRCRCCHHRMLLPDDRLRCCQLP